MTPTSPPLSMSIHAVLTWLLGSGAGALMLDARSEGGFGHQRLCVSAVDPGFVPEPILALLEHRLGWHLRITPIVRDPGNDHVLLRLNVVFVRWLLEPAFSADTNWERRIALDDARRVQHQIDAFPLLPSAVIDGAKEIIAVWRLTEPIDLHGATALDRTLALQLRLAGVLGASTAPIPHDEYGGHDPRSFLPFAGEVREMGRNVVPHVVHVAELHGDRVYTLDQIEAAIRGEAPPRRAA